MTTKTKTPAPREASPQSPELPARPDSEDIGDLCATCPARSTAKDSSYDYCEGCEHIERRCDGCNQYRPQSGWWWGYDQHGLAHVWVCATCRLPYPSEAWVLAHPEAAATHPDHARIVGEHARFTASLDMPADEVRYAVVAAVTRAAGLSGHGQTAGVLSAMAASLRSSDTVDVDTSALPMMGRRVVERLLRTAAWAETTPQAASPIVARLAGLWDAWLNAQLPKDDKPRTFAEQAAQERAAVRRSRERKATG